MISMLRIRIIAFAMALLILVGLWSLLNTRPTRPQDPRARLVYEQHVELSRISGG